MGGLRFVSRFDMSIMSFVRRPGFVVKLASSKTGDVIEMHALDLGVGDIGFRDDGIDGEPFGLCLGDSFTEGVGVDFQHTWVELLEDRVGRDFANLGRGGTGAQYAWGVYRHYFLHVPHRVVIYGLFYNDFGDDWLFRRRAGLIKDRCGSDPVCGEEVAMEFGVDVGRHLKTAWTGSHRIHLFRMFRWLSLRAGGALSRAREWNEAAGQEFLSFDFAEIRDRSATYEALRFLRQEAEERGAEFSVLLFPTKEMVYSIRIDRKEIQRSAELNHVLRDDIRRELNGMGIRFLDLYPVLRNAVAMGAVPYLAHDDHWTKEGHERVAAAVHGALSEWRWLP